MAPQKTDWAQLGMPDGGRSKRSTVTVGDAFQRCGFHGRQLRRVRVMQAAQHIARAAVICPAFHGEYALAGRSRTSGEREYHPAAVSQ